MYCLGFGAFHPSCFNIAIPANNFKLIMSGKSDSKYEGFLNAALIRVLKENGRAVLFTGLSYRYPVYCNLHGMGSMI